MANAQAPHPQRPIKAGGAGVAAAPQLKTSVSGDRPFASPAAKFLASERGIDLSRIASGSGMDGMITSKDVENFTGSPAAAAGTAQAAPSYMSAIPGIGGAPSGSYSDAELTNMRKTIAKRLQASKQVTMHYGFPQGQN